MQTLQIEKHRVNLYFSQSNLQMLDEIYRTTFALVIATCVQQTYKSTFCSDMWVVNM